MTCPHHMILGNQESLHAGHSSSLFGSPAISRKAHRVMLCLMSSNCISRDPPNLTLFREGSGRFGRGARGRDTGKFLWPPRTLSAEESASWRLPEDSIPSSLNVLVSENVMEPSFTRHLVSVPASHDHPRILYIGLHYHVLSSTSLSSRPFTSSSQLRLLS